MEDEGGEDNKMLCVLEEQYNPHMNMSSIGDSALDAIEYFFQNYKKNEPGKWSKVTRFLKKDNAYEYYYYTKVLYLNPVIPDVD
jgi:inorganic pyrophosphatase